MIKLKIKIYLLFLFTSSFIFSDNKGSKVDCLVKKVNVINSISPVNEDFSDLMFLKPILEDKRIVFLGENTHYDGSSEIAQVRMIKFLQKEMGYDFLLLESGFTEVDRAYRDIVSKNDSVTGVFCWLTNFFGWNITTDDWYLSKYIENTINENKPLKLGGIDINEGSIYSNNFFSEIESIFEKNVENYSNSETENAFIDFSQKGRLKKVIGNNLLDKTKSFRELEKLRSSSIILIEKLEEIKGREVDGDTKTRMSFYQRGIRSRWGLIDWEFNRSDLDFEQRFNFEWTKIRDKYMAENLEWFLETYPNEKFIVTASSFHVGRNFSSLKSRPKELGNSVPMGEFIWNKYGCQMYSISFIRYSGSIGEMDSPSHRSYEVLKPAKNKSLEGKLNLLNQEYLFLDFDSTNNCCNKPFFMFPTFSSPIKADWTQNYDAVFFIKEMKPNQLIGYPNRLEIEQPYKTPPEWFEN